MAQGDVSLFYHTARSVLMGGIDLLGGNPMVQLITNEKDLARVSDESPVLADYSAAAVSPTGLVNTTFIEASGKAPFKSDSVTFPATPGVNNVYQALLYIGEDPYRAFGFIDLTTDGGETPVDLSTTSLTIPFGTSGKIMSADVG